MRLEEILSELVATPSINPMGAAWDDAICGERRVVQVLSDWLTQSGIDFRIDSIDPHHSNLVAWVNGSTTHTIWLDAHMDTVPADGMTIDPFGARIENGRLFGRGSCDVKGGLAVMLHTLQRWHAQAVEGGPTLVLSCTADEEHNTTGIRRIVEDWQAHSQSDPTRRPPTACIVAEPTGLDVVVAHRGVVRWAITTAGTACHSSDPSRGHNAIYDMAEVVQHLSAYADGLMQRPAHPRCGRPTLSVGRIEGGESINVVPDQCRIEVERRVVPGEAAECVREEIVDYLDRHCEVPLRHHEPWLTSHPLNDDNNEWLADPLRGSAERVHGGSRCVGVPYGTHASRTAAVGVPSVVFGPGHIAQAHTVDEWIELTQLESAAESMFTFLTDHASWLPA